MIEHNSTRKLNLDLIDLPGIVGGSLPGEPSNMMDLTRKLSESFLNDPKNPHCLILCVVSNRTERVRNSQAMELVQRFKKVDSTIGVLTMVDLSKDTVRNPANPYWALKERLQGTSQDMPILKYGYVAVKNRDTMQDQGLAGINESEMIWLRTNFPEVYSGSTQNNSLLQSKLGISSLTSKLVHMLDSYSESIWAPNEISRLRDEIEKVKKEIDCLGPILSFPELISQTMGSMAQAAYETYLSVDEIRSVCDAISVFEEIGIRVISEGTDHYSKVRTVYEVPEYPSKDFFVRK